MPVFDAEGRPLLPFTVSLADKPLPRLIGLIGTQFPPADRLLHIVPCRSIHTFGMRYPIDVVALTSDGLVKETAEKVAPNQIVRFGIGTASVLEGPAGWVSTAGLKPGCTVRIEADHPHRADLNSLRSLMHWPLNLFISLLWFRLVLSLLHVSVERPSFLNTAMLLHNSLLMFFFLLRRESKETSTKLFDWLLPFAVIAAAMSLRPSTPHLPSAIPVAVQSVGIVAIIYSLAALGRSFGIVPANRTVKRSGAYRWVRHPLYTSEVIFYLGYCLGNPSLRNFFLLVFIAVGQVRRAMAEEQLLLKDPEYRQYVQNVPYRFFPGLF